MALRAAAVQSWENREASPDDSEDRSQRSLPVWQRQEVQGLPRRGMRVQILSDLHLETETFEPEPAPGAELLVLGGDIDSSWAELERFRD